MEFTPKNKRELQDKLREISRYNGAIPLAWDLKNVDDFSGLLMGIHDLERFSFLSDWDVSHVKNMEGMFSGLETFNIPLNNWDVSNVETMRSMFYDCISFNQPLTNWKLNPNVNTTNMFWNCPISPENMPANMKHTMRRNGITAEILDNNYNPINYNETKHLRAGRRRRSRKSRKNKRHRTNKRRNQRRHTSYRKK